MSSIELPPRAASTAELPAAVEHPRPAAITLEQVAYLIIFLLALVIRLWGLGDRALHHDETLHAYYSWLVYQGRGYVHDPLLHGPFLYFFGAFLYFLFGSSDATARLGPAIFGVALVMLPYFLRRELGRPAALMASIYLLISPAFVYIARFIRHDPYTIVFELLALIGLVRYATTRRPLWLYVVAVTLALMFVTMETFFLYVTIFAPVVALALFWKLWKPGLGIVAGLGVVVLALVFWLPGYPERPFPQSDTVNRVAGPYICPSAVQPYPPANPMLVARPGPLFGWPPLATYDNNYALCVRHQPDNDIGLYLIKLGEFVAHPAILSGIVIVPATLLALWWVVWKRRGVDQQTHWQRAAASGNATVQVFASLGRDRRLLIAFGLFFLVYALFFSAFLTNPAGVVSGTTGSLLYWLAQHEVQRGGQPAHYYTVLMAIYEPLALLWGVIGLVMTAVMSIRALARARSASAADEPTDDEQRLDWRLTLPLLLSWWSIATFVLYSWAGEKMPWLTVHVALPFTLLGAWAAGQVWTWWREADQDAEAPGVLIGGRLVRPLPVFLGLFAAISVYCYVLLTVAIRTDTPMSSLSPWIAPLWLVLAGLLTAGAWLMRGRRWAFGALAIGVTLLCGAYTLRSSYQLSFRYGDIPREMMIYTQTAPDVKLVIDRLDAALARRSALAPAPIWYDNETVWDWYTLRYPGAIEQPPELSAAPGNDVLAVLMLRENYDLEQNRRFLDGFRVQRYPLRWWFPEDETYRLPRDWLAAEVTDNSPLLMRMLRQPFDARTSAQFWQYMLYRVPPQQLGSTDFVLAVRPELAAEIGLGVGGGR